ncbi:PTS transporter subunit IIABC [Mycoplasma sp. Ms02]|uniref:PTS transporter subunit IIABC n=1 Tax=Mycoplasma sp. Ms02 TaxID=353851 RepID=UPI001C8912DC|nr:PTS transporter subunit IIABC [Mycoplasma sp. Ms02]QZE12459.1 glucose PTS transporter subunit IIA [Mycoplasma sp. Ms02]
MKTLGLGKSRLFAKKDKKLDNSGSGKMRKILSKISGAFMLPISVMAISGLWLGVGAAIANNAADGSGLETFGKFIQMLGDPVFSALPLLFAAAFVIAFTDEAGVAVFAAIIGYLVFTAVQSPFITPVRDFAKLSDTPGTELFYYNGALPENSKDYVNENFTSFKVSGLADGPVILFKKNIKEVLENGVKVEKVEWERVITLNQKDEISRLLNLQVTGYNVLFSGLGRDAEVLKSTVGSTLGFTSLQTSVFGGLTVGLIVQYLYNRYHTIQLPGMFSFFGGKRFVAIVTVPAMAVLAFVFLLLWPWVGVGLSAFGNVLGKVPLGIESFIFGFMERSLVPFGLHHAFYSPLWYSNAGGDLNSALQTWTTNKEVVVSNFDANLMRLIKEVAEEPSKFVGDSTMSNSLLKFPDTVSFTKTVNGVSEKVTLPLFTFVAQELGVKVGRFMDGKFSFMIFGLPAAAAAMVMAAPKENRKVALSAVVPSAVTSLVTGVTEPIEFTFLFLAPYLFWGFHAFFCAVSFMAANIAGVHVPMSFSGGLLDLTIYGAVNVAKGTNFYWSLLIGLVYVPVYFFGFWFFIKKFNLETPGRGSNTKLFNKKDFLAKKDGSEEVDPRALAVVQAYGGLSNITAFNNCASRLRYDVVDSALVDEAALKAAGATAIKIEGKKHVQAIFGPAAEQLNTKIKASREAIAAWEAKGNKLEAPVQEEQVASQESSDVLSNPVVVSAVTDGKLLSIESIQDGVFSEKMMGEGFAMDFSENAKTGMVYAPVSGKLTVLFDSKHAYGIETSEGVQVLVHIGIDTVTLNGKGFKTELKVGDEVKAGDLLAQVDLAVLKEHNLKSSPIVVVLSESTHKDVTFVKEADQELSVKESVLEVR